jgi:tetratricopeptide (TPR) repeat protein
VGNEIDEGFTALKRAEALNPNSAQIGMFLGWVHNYRNEPEAAIPVFERAKRLSPLHPQIGVFTCGIGNALMQMGRFDEAVRLLELALTEYPEFATTQMALMATYWHSAGSRTAPGLPNCTVRRHRISRSATSGRTGPTRTRCIPRP